MADGKEKRVSSGWYARTAKRFEDLKKKDEGGRVNAPTSRVYRWFKKGRPADGLGDRVETRTPRSSTRRSSSTRTPSSRRTPSSVKSVDSGTRKAREMSPGAFARDLGERTKAQIARGRARMGEARARGWTIFKHVRGGRRRHTRRRARR